MGELFFKEYLESGFKQALTLLQYDLQSSLQGGVRERNRFSLSMRQFDA